MSGAGVEPSDLFLLPVCHVATADPEHIPAEHATDADLFNGSRIAAAARVPIRMEYAGKFY